MFMPAKVKTYLKGIMFSNSSVEPGHNNFMNEENGQTIESNSLSKITGVNTTSGW